MMFSIVVPLYNKEKYIKKTLLSIINQKFEDYEIIVIDDGSTDRSAEVVDNLKGQYPKLKLYRYLNSGVSAARNRGIGLAQGDFIIFLDADDVLKKEYLNDVFITINALNGHFSILGYNYLFNGKRIVPSSIKDGYINYFEMYLTFGPPFCSSSVILNKEKIQHYKELFPENEWLGEDIYAWSKVILDGGLVYYRNMIAAEYVMQPGSAMSKKKTQIKLIRPDSALVSTDPQFHNFVVYHKKDYLKSCFIHRNYNDARIFLKNNKRNDYVFYNLLSLIPDSILDFIFSIKKAIK